MNAPGSQPLPVTLPNAVEPRLEAVLEPVVATMGFELVAVEWTQASKSRRLRVYVDRATGVSLDDCARLSPIISSTLDAAEGDPELARLLAGAYTLEVSSPGLDRPLARRSHFERFIGAKANVKLSEPLDPETRQRNFRGRIVATEADMAQPSDDRRGIIVLQPEDGEHSQRLPLALIRRAHLVYEGS